MRYFLITGLTCAALLVDLTAVAAQSTRDVPPPTVLGSTPADAAAAPDPTASKPKPKPKGPPGAVTVINASANTVTEVVITAGDKSAMLSKPLAPKGRTAVKLPKMNGCTVSVAATFEGGSRSDADAFDVCKEKLIRFIEP